MCNYFGSLKHENVPLGYGKMRPSLLFWTIKILKTVLILSIRLLSYQQSKEKYEPKNFMTLALRSGINIGGEYNDNFKIKSCLAPRKTDWKGLRLCGVAVTVAWLILYSGVLMRQLKWAATITLIYESIRATVFLLELQTNLRKVLLQWWRRPNFTSNYRHFSIVS